MKKHLAAIGIALSSVVGGVAVGATMFTPTLASAQEADPTPDEGEAGEACARPPGGNPGRLAAAAEAIGITVDELHEALEGGQSIADVAAANGVDVQTVIDALTAQVAEHLADEVTNGEITQAEADERLAAATERITDRVNTAPPPRPEGAPEGGQGRPPRGERPPRPAPPADDDDAEADAS